MVRLQRLTSDPAQTKFLVLNHSLSSSASAPPNRGSKSSSSSSPTSPSHTNHNDAAEVVFLQEALDYCDEERRRGEEENAKLRELLGEVGEWTEGMLEMNGVKGGEEQQEAAAALDADEVSLRTLDEERASQF
jgi:hypothetical protein